MKQYRLLKDTPFVKAGSIGDIAVYGGNPTYIFSNKSDNGVFTISQDDIIKRPDWFEEVKPFEWTDELVWDFIGAYILQGSKRPFDEIMEEFKQQKAQHNADLA